MARVRVNFNGGDVPVVIGDAPPSENDPILNPTPTHGRTNRSFLFDTGLFTFALDAATPFKPKWQTKQAADGIPLTMTFEIDTADVVEEAVPMPATAAKPKRARDKKPKTTRAKKRKPARAAKKSKVKQPAKAKPARVKKPKTRKAAR